MGLVNKGNKNANLSMFFKDFFFFQFYFLSNLILLFYRMWCLVSNCIHFLLIPRDRFIPNGKRRKKGIIFLILPNFLEAFNESLKENEALAGVI